MASRDILAKMAVEISANTRRFNAQIKRTNKTLNTLTTSVSRVGGAVGIAFGGSQLINGIGQGIRKIADFEQQMDTVAAVSRASAEEVQELTDNALELGRQSKFTASQIGSMQEVLARLGFTTDQITGTTDAVRKLATAAGDDLAPSAQILAGTMKSFNLEAEESERVANVMAESFASTSLDLERFGSAMSNVGAIAEVSNESLEATVAKLGTLVDRNIEASKAGTDLRRIFINLAASGMSYDDAMEQIRNSTDKVKTATDLFGDRAAAAAIILADNDKQVRSLTAGFADANRELSEMVKIMEDNLNNDLKLLESAIDGVIQKGGVLTGTMRAVVQGMTTVVNQLSEFTSAGGGVEAFFARFIPLSGGAIAALELLNRNTQAYRTEQEKLNEQLEKTEKNIQSTVEAAFDSGNVEAYIKALDQNINREEVIKRIRERQAELGRAAFEASFPEQYNSELEKQVGILTQLNEKIKLNEKAQLDAAPRQLIALQNQNAQLREQRRLYQNIAEIARQIPEGPILQTIGFEGLQDPGSFEGGLKPVNADRILPIGIIEELQRRLAIAQQNFQKALDPESVRQYAEEIKTLQGAINNYSGTTDEAQLFTESFAQSVGFALGQAATASSSFSDFLINTIRQIIPALLAQALGQAIAGATSTGPLGVFAIPAFVGIVQAAFANLPKFAEGGIATKPTVGIFGEAGPEALVPLKQMGRFAQELNISGEFRLNGRDLLAAVRANENLQNRTR